MNIGINECTFHCFAFICSICGQMQTKSRIKFIVSDYLVDRFNWTNVNLNISRSFILLWRNKKKSIEILLEICIALVLALVFQSSATEAVNDMEFNDGGKKKELIFWYQVEWICVSGLFECLGRRRRRKWKELLWFFRRFIIKSMTFVH